MLKRLAIVICVGASCLASAKEAPFSFDESLQENPPSAWRALFEAQLRLDEVRDLPRPVEADFDRWEARARFGVDWQPDETLSFRATGRAFFAEQENTQMAFNLDNERLRDTAIDELYLDMQSSASGNILVGQSTLPLTLSPMIWDQDLRWRGLHVQGIVGGLPQEHRLSLSRGRIDHAFGSGARLSAAQWQWRFGQERGTTEILLTRLVFDHLDAMPETFRTNSRAGADLAARFRIVDLQFAQTIGNATDAVRFTIDVARNLDVEAEGDAARADVRYGDALASGGFEFGAAVQRIQADAVPAAFNDDDWWFPSRMRGHAAWMSFGFRGGWSARVAAFREKRDGVETYTQRVLLDVSWRF